jgi:hypothetical protein
LLGEDPGLSWQSVSVKFHSCGHTQRRQPAASSQDTMRSEVL